jgi:TPR repeat protein
MYYKGMGVQKDLSKAREYAKKAEERGYSLAKQLLNSIGR